jgi:hypothetical protein
MGQIHHPNKVKFRRHKFGAVPTVVKGIRFASKAEARRFATLSLLERAKEISGLELQPSYKLEVNGQLVCTYRADFRYRTKDGKTVVEDVKGIKTPEYRLKAKLMKAIHGIEILETK